MSDWRGAGQTVLYTKEGEFVDSWRMVQPDRSRIVPWRQGPRGWLGHYYDANPPSQPAPGEASARPADSGENSGGGRGRGDLQWSLTFGPKLPHCGHRYGSPPASSTNRSIMSDSFSI